MVACRPWAPLLQRQRTILEISLSQDIMDKGKGKQVALDGFLVNGGKAYLQDLNEAQRESVTWKSTGGLQILAGPGSGSSIGFVQ